MGRIRKKWVDKKNDTTFSLVYRAAAEASEGNAEERILYPKGQYPSALPSRRPIPGGRANEQDVDGDEFYDDEEGSWDEDEEWTEGEDEDEAYPAAGPSAPTGDDEWEAKRREIISLGFPDDGYDYLKHLRVLGQGQASMAPVAAKDPSIVTVRPVDLATGNPALAPAVPEGEGEDEDLIDLDAEELMQVAPDVKIFDARRLTVQKEAADDADAEGQLGGVSAFARPMEMEVEDVRKRYRDIREVDNIMMALDEDIEAQPEDIGLESLLDDFVLEATRENEARTQQLIADYERRAAREDEYEDDEDEEERRLSGFHAAPRAIPLDGQSMRSHISRHHKTGQSRAIIKDEDGRTVASQWNRQERVDRTDAQTIIDEKFERLALEYEDDELGDLEEEAEDARGPKISEQRLNKVLDEFIKKYPKPASMLDEEEQHDGLNGQKLGGKIGRASLSEQFEEDDDDARLARERAKQAIRKALGAIPEDHEAQLEAEDDRKRETELIRLEREEAERWDCETVLSLRSNLENHPARLSEPPNPRKKKQASEAGSVRVGLAAAGLIQLSSKSGIPIGYAGAPTKRGGGGYGALEGAGSDEESSGDEGGPSNGGPRRKGETKEEKKARKNAVKEARREARENKKELRSVYKETTVTLAKTQPSKAVSIMKL